ncbi:MAG: HAD family hydrolase [Clostridiales bacterium]|nr:HAD family hydrolase [Clostridiales bacterium]
MVQGIIFDMDGTLLDTLDDLTDSVNFSMKSLLCPTRSKDEIRDFLGNGVERLIELSIPRGKENPNFLEAVQIFKEHYSQNDNVKTKPYDGIMELLNELKQLGITCSVVSNKYQAAVVELKEKYFGNKISFAIGETKGVSRKPAPDMVNLALGKMCLPKEEVIFIGDSEVDIETARNAGLKGIFVSWGFRGRQKLIKLGAKYIADYPRDILKLLKE